MAEARQRNAFERYRTLVVDVDARREIIGGAVLLIVNGKIRAVHHDFAAGADAQIRQGHDQVPAGNLERAVADDVSAVPGPGGAGGGNFERRARGDRRGSRPGRGGIRQLERPGRDRRAAGVGVRAGKRQRARADLFELHGPLQLAGKRGRRVVVADDEFPGNVICRRAVDDRIGRRGLQAVDGFGVASQMERGAVEHHQVAGVRAGNS